MKTKVICLASVCAVGLFAGASAARAQVTAPATQTASTDSSGAQQGDILVTARKRTENLVDTPLAISAYRGEALASRGVPNIHQLDTISPSLTITNFGAGNISDATVFIRGIGTADHLILTDPGVGVYLD